MKTQNMTSRRGVLKLLSGTVIASGLIATTGRAQSASVATIGDSAIAIDFDLSLNSRILARQNGKVVELTDFAPSETVTLADGRVIDRFPFADKSQEPLSDIHGKGILYTVRGVSPEGLEKTVEIAFYDRYPGFAIAKVTYRNTSSANIDVAAWTSHSHMLKGTTFWSFSGSSHDDRRDWVQPVKAGFDQPNFMGMNASDYGSGTPIGSVMKAILEASALSPAIKSVLDFGGVTPQELAAKAKDALARAEASPPTPPASGPGPTST